MSKTVSTQNTTANYSQTSKLNGSTPFEVSQPKKASSAKKTAKQAAKTAKKTTKNAAKKVARTATKGAEAIADDAVGHARRQVENATDAGISQTEHFVGSISRAVKAAGESLESDGMPRVAAYTNAAASGLDRAASEVDGIDASKIGGKVENLVRQNPFLTLGALTVVGFALAGALKKK